MSTYAAEDYARMMLGALPEGAAWNRDPDSMMRAVMLAIGDGLARLEARATALLDEADPRTTVALLPDWERNYGLPDPCSGTPDSIAGRQQELVGRVLFRGGQSNQFFVQLAASYGFAITVDKYPVATVDDDCAAPLNDDSWAFALQINAPQTTIIYADCALSGCSDPLASWGNAVLECVLRRGAHGYLDLIFVYS